MRKNKNFFRRAVSLVSVAVMALAPFAVNISAVHAGEQLGQTNFDEGVGLPWHICESEPAKMDFEIENGVYKITIVNTGGASQGGEDRWDCQFRHRGLKIEAGHQYRVTYEITASNSGKYYTKIGNLDGDVEVWHNMCTGQGDFDQNWDCIPINANETRRVDLTFTPTQSMETAEWAFHLGGDGQYTQGGCFPAGTVITFDNMSLVDLTSDENDYIAPEPWQRADILTNQVGYFTDGQKKATLLCSDSNGVDFDVVDSSGESVFSGTSEPFGYDEDSGDSVHIIDFSGLDTEGTFYIEAENGSKSREFEVGGTEKYSAMLYDSLNYFYQNRSATDIKSEYITSGDKNALARPAGHTSDIAEIQQTWGYSGTSGTVDVTGGWYDAGDHGKYVVNGGLSLWLMQNQYETALKYGYEDVYADGTMSIPENSNGFPDLLDEARWEMEWMFSMVVDSGDYEGMVYHKVHDEKWTALAVAPADDDMKRIVKPPTTTATLNFVACASQASRLWKGIDDEFSEKCLEYAEKSYESAKKHPDMYAPLDESIGGGAYGDNDASDEFIWAGTELYITTGDEKYLDDVSFEVPVSLGGGESVDTVGSFDWGNTKALGSFSAVLYPDMFENFDEIKENILSAGDYYIEKENQQGYGLPYGQSTLSYDDSDKGYLWGSNSFVSDNSIVMAYAYLLSQDEKYLDGVTSGVDYLLGRNAMDYSYVTGYGSHAVENVHHRYWSQQVDETFPKAPCGVLSGGPNSGMQDPWVKGSGWKKGEISPQKCYLDHIEAWSVNECAINWNASLAWLISFTAQQNGGIEVGYTGESAGVSNNGGDGQSNKNQVYTETEKNSESPTKAVEVSEGDAEGDSDSITRKNSNSDKDENIEQNSGVAKTVTVGIVSFAILAGLISMFVFIYKMTKLKYGFKDKDDSEKKQ